MIGSCAAPPVFHDGDKVMLVKGPYQGTPGVFLRLKEDVNWADITERNGVIRSHPMAWLALNEPRPPGNDGPRTHGVTDEQLSE